MQGNGRGGEFGGNLAGRYPAEIESYDQASRTCRVHVYGLTDGSSERPIADIEYPIGDRSAETELKILPGDSVWVSFMGGDSRHPIVTGFRNPRAGNGVNWRKFHHANVELSATGKFVIQAAEIELVSGKLTHNGVDISDKHKHKGVAKGRATTDEPV